MDLVFDPAQRVGRVVVVGRNEVEFELLVPGGVGTLRHNRPGALALKPGLNIRPHTGQFNVALVCKNIYMSFDLLPEIFLTSKTGVLQMPSATDVNLGYGVISPIYNSKAKQGGIL